MKRKISRIEKAQCFNVDNRAINKAAWSIKDKRPAITGRCSNLSVHLIFSGHLVS